MEGFGKRLKELRQSAKITQSGLAEKLNLHPQTVSKWERGLSEPDIAQLGDLAAALGITLERLLGQEDPEQSYIGNFQAEAFGKMLSELPARILKGFPLWPTILRFPHRNCIADVLNRRRRKVLRMSKRASGFPS